MSRARGADGADDVKVRRGGRVRRELGVILGDRFLWGDLAQRAFCLEEGNFEERGPSRVTVSWEPARSGEGLRVDVLDFVIDALSLLRERSLGVSYDLEPTAEELGRFVESLAEP